MKPPTRIKLGLLLVAIALSLIAGYWFLRKPAPDSTASQFKVALLLSGPIDDQGYSQSGYEGLRMIERKLGAHVAYSAHVSPADAPDHFRRYAREGYDFIIGHGGEYRAAAETVAEEFPRTKFAVVTSHPGNNRNLGALSFRGGEVGYLAGVVAALKTETKKVGFIGGEIYPSTVEDTVLFQRGVKAIDPSVQVSIAWVKSWTDAERARRMAASLIAQGVDVLVLNADLAGLGAFEVIRKSPAHAIGWSVDQHALAPNAVVTSALQRVPVLLLEGATLVQQGRWEGKQYKFGLREGAQDLAPFRGKLSPEQETIVQSVREDLMLGRIDLTP